MEEIIKSSTHPTVSALIRKSILIGVLCISAIMLAISLYISHNNLNHQARENFTHTLAIISKLLAPSLIISDTIETRKVINWVSNSQQKFAVIDNNNDLILGNYNLSEQISSLFKNNEPTHFCNSLTQKTVVIDNKIYQVFCSTISEHNTLEMIPKQQRLGILIGLQDSSNITLHSSFIFYLLAICIITILLTTIWLNTIFKQRLVKPLLRLKATIQNISNTALVVSNIATVTKKVPKEIQEIEFEFNNLLTQLNVELKNKAEYDKNTALFGLASQVAHDIRSPIAALNTLINLSSKLTDQEKQLTRNAIQRINDISNNILIKYSSKNEIDAIETNTLSTAFTPLYISMHNIVSEKRFQLNQHKKIEFNVIAIPQDSLLISSAKTEVIERALSNILNNAIDAIADKGEINLSLKKSSHHTAIITIQDNGMGMSAEILHKVKMGSYTTKRNGSGIGLSSTINALRATHGDLKITSLENIGTTITMELPLTTIPPWFTNTILITPDCDIISCDDDQCISDTWQRLLHDKKSQINYHHFSNPEEILTQTFSSTNNIFLIDYEYRASALSGFDIIKNLKHKGAIYLVSCRWNDHELLQFAQKNHIKIIPKPLISKLTIKLIQNIPDMILIDDNQMLRETWQLVAQKRHINLQTFSNLYDLLQNVYLYPREIPIYLDLYLSDETNGLDFSKQLSDLGFYNIYLCTGRNVHEIPPAPWLKAIRGKEPPF